MKNTMIEKVNLSELFGCNVLSDEIIKNKLKPEHYEAYRLAVNGGELTSETAEILAKTMMDWAIEKGATHYTHWFQPLNGVTAEKHEAFISSMPGGKIDMEFSGKMLIKGEADASSFPSGGLRATFEARGYTAWDCTSPVFLKEDVSGVSLYIPTAFCSYNGDALDTKTPLLRSMEVINKHALRILKLFGDTATDRVDVMVGAEQEYFLIEKSLFKKRSDLVMCGRTLYGARPAKTQELEDHYFGSINERVSEFMKELDIELWKMGVSAKTKHNETAPAQHELAPVYISANIASDQNQLIMETMKKVADRRGLACLLNEKPFDYINGSGKHNNWSINSGLTGKSLLKPGSSPEENYQFLIFLTAIIAAVDTHADLLRLTAAHSSNDRRLGGYEAPPAIISIFLGDLLTGILESFIEANGNGSARTERRRMKTGVNTLPRFYMDDSDRNRTSPFAFTSNKFEFRMLGSSMSIADTNTIINAIVSEQLDEIATRLDGVPEASFLDEVKAIIGEKYSKHKRVVFNGNGYSPLWKEQAELLGLPCLSTTVDAIPALVTEKSIDLFSNLGIMSKEELTARYDIYLEMYSKQITIEAKVMLEMAISEIIPASCEYAGKVASSVNSISAAGVDPKFQINQLNELNSLIQCASEMTDGLIGALEIKKDDNLEEAQYVRDVLIPAMEELRKTCDRLEENVRKRYWPFPTYTEILYTV